MMCIFSKQWIAFCTQVEGTRGEVFEVSPIALQSRYKCVPNGPIATYGHSWPSTPECSFKIGDQHSEKKRRNCDGRGICNATGCIDAGHGVNRHRDVPDGSDGPHPLKRSHSARTELFFPDVLYLVEKLKIGSGMSWESRRISWIRTGKDVGLYISKTCEWNCMPWIDGPNR
jgi:hypothetical protein